MHVVGPEQGLTLPGLLIVCGDSHTSTHGAFGAYAFGIGASEVAHVLMTQTLWQKKPKRMRITVDGKTAAGIAAKDIALAIIARIGADGAQGHAIEFAGERHRGAVDGRPHDAVQHVDRGRRALRHGGAGRDHFRLSQGPALCPEGRGVRPGRRGLVRRSPPTATRRSTARLRSMPPRSRRSSLGVRRRTMRCRSMRACPIQRASPMPARAKYLREALDYMGIAAGTKLTDIKIDRVFIGSCTNARIEDLRAAAAVLAGRASKVPGLVSPGSSPVKRQAEEEGLDRIFRDAGLEWADSGCSMCVGINGDLVAAGRTLRLDHQPQFPRPSGARRAHAFDVAGHGGRGSRQRTPRRRAAVARRAQT